MQIKTTGLVRVKNGIGMAYVMHSLILLTKCTVSKTLIGHVPVKILNIFSPFVAVLNIDTQYSQKMTCFHWNMSA